MQQISSEPGASRGGEREAGGRRAAPRKSRAAQCAQGMAVRAMLRGICAGLRPRFFLSAAFFLPHGNSSPGKVRGKGCVVAGALIETCAALSEELFSLPTGWDKQDGEIRKPCAEISPENALCTRLSVSRSKAFCTTPVFP